MKIRVKTSLEAKLCLLTIGTLFVVMLGVGHLAMTQNQKMLMEQKTEGFEAVTRALSLSASQLVAKSDPKLIELVSSRVKNSHLELEYLIVADKAGRTLYAESQNLPKKPYPEGMRWWVVARRIMGYGGISTDNIHSVSVPAMVGPNELGTLTAGFKLTRAKELADTVQAMVLLAMAIGLILGVICAVVMARSMSGALQSLIQGAKDVSAGNFGFRIMNETGDEIEDLTEAFNYMVETLGNSHERLVERANTDSLTGLYNHRYFQERLAAEVSRASRYGHSLSLLIIDIDFFKNFNDAHGHPTGDTALREIGVILTQSTREADVAVRYGGEEFAIILPETPMREAASLAERIRQAVEKHVFYDGNGEQTSLTISAGLAEHPTHCSDRTSLIAAADTALYQAKVVGRNRVECYDSEASAFPHPDPYKLYVLLHAHDLATIEALADAVDAKLKFPAGHSKAVAHLTSETAKKLGMSETQCASLYLAALLRDIGQIAIPDSILGKADSLTEEEMSAVATHPTLGHAIVQKAPHLTSMLPAILHHHEHFDGTGYPDGLSGDNVPLAARIVAAADAYQAMITSRPHRRRMTPYEAQAELAQRGSTQFDPKVIEALLQVLESHQSGEEAA